MKEIVINIDSSNKDSIKTIQGNNNAEVYKIYVLQNRRRLNLVGKTVKLGYVMAGTTKGDVIENLNITNAEQGEITFPITNRISKMDGVYSCQLAIYADEFLEYTATFGLTVEANIFNKIASEIVNSKDLTYIENILEEAKTVSKDLKDNIPVANNLNSSLENNISDANNINTTLANTIEKSKVTATDAIEKKSQLENSIVEAKKFIDGLDGSQDIPGMRMELTELQNGLKSNQTLEYSGSSIRADNTLEGRTEGMVIKGKTLYKKKDGSYTDIWEDGVSLESFGEAEQEGDKYKISILSHGKNLCKDLVLGSWDINTGTFNSSPNALACKNKIKVEKGTYFLSSNSNIKSFYICKYSKDGNFLSSVENKTVNFEYDGFITFYIPTETNLNTKVLLEEGTSATSYEHYKEDKKAILIKEPLRSIGDVYDVMKENNGQIIVNRYTRQYTFTGDENWVMWSVRDGKIGGTLDVGLKPKSKLMCDNFIVYDQLIQDNKQYRGIMSDNVVGNVNLSIDASELITQDINGLKAWLKANPTTIIYQLATPTIEVVGNCVDIDLDTYQEKTYFNILNSLPGTLDFKVPSNIASIVQSNSKAINELYNLIDTLVLPNILQNTTDIEMLKLEKLK